MDPWFLKVWKVVGKGRQQEWAKWKVETMSLQMSMLAYMGPRHVSSPPPSSLPHCPHLPTMQSSSQIRMFTDFVLISLSLGILSHHVLSLSHHQTIEVSCKDDFMQFSYPNLKSKLCFQTGSWLNLGALLPDDVAESIWDARGQFLSWICIWIWEEILVFDGNVHQFHTEIVSLGKQNVLNWT